MSETVKATDAEIIERVNVVYGLLIKGFRRSEILQYASEKTEWNVSERQIDTYISRANKLFDKAANYRRTRELGKAVERLNVLFMSCLKVQDYGRALAVQRELNLLLGLHDESNKAPATVAIVIEHETTAHSAPYTLQPPGGHHKQPRPLQGSGDGPEDWQDDARRAD